MSLVTQKGFWNDTIIANTRERLGELYRDVPEAFESEKKVVLEYWLRCEGLEGILGDKLQDFKTWFLSVTSVETITRCLRSLKEDGTIALSDASKNNRKEKEQEWRSYWGNRRDIDRRIS